LPADILIIGAGAAGLAAAADLAKTRQSVLVLEARDRIGGRCWTRHEAGLAVPVEMGPEFIHGRPRATFSLMEKSGIAAIKRTGARWLARGGRLHPSDRATLFMQVEQAMEAVGAPRKDVPFETYILRNLKERLSPEAQTFALRMVEGYDAADPARVSARAIVEEWTGEGSANDASYRPVGGYGALISALAAELAASGGRLQLQSAVHSVQWKRGHVQVEGVHLGKPFRESAARAVVALPLGVLQRPPGTRGAVRFTPPLAEKKRALDHLSSGPVMRVALKFHTAFWEELDKGRYRDAGFMQSPDALFPTFWTSLPARAPLLVCWAGGPRAQRMAGLSGPAVVRNAVASVKSLVGKLHDVEAQLETSYFHDWQRDPYARGAYAWVKAGGSGARKSLAAPLKETLYFAGEASDYEGEAGTVAGALHSGTRAARQML
jgi:monoamine oxidase